MLATIERHILPDARQASVTGTSGKLRVHAIIRPADPLNPRKGALTVTVTTKGVNTLALVDLYRCGRLCQEVHAEVVRLLDLEDKRQWGTERVRDSMSVSLR